MAERYSRNNERDLRSRNIDWGKIIDHALKTEGSTYGIYDRARNYSTANKMLFAAQGIYEPVASKKIWDSLGRVVLENAKPKDVIVPNIRRWREKDENGEWQKFERVIGFNVVSAVFAMSDTEGPELPPLKLPEWDQDTALKNLRINLVPFQHDNLNVQGYAYDRNIAISEVAAKPKRTLIHEMGHIVLGHTIGEASEERHRGIKEAEAEGTALITLNELSILDEETASISRSYMRGWLDKGELPDRSIQRIFNAVDTILKAGRATISPTVELNTDVQ